MEKETLVIWNDPDNNLSSGIYNISDDSMKAEDIFVLNESTEVYSDEILPLNDFECIIEKNDIGTFIDSADFFDFHNNTKIASFNTDFKEIKNIKIELMFMNNNGEKYINTVIKYRNNVTSSEKLIGVVHGSINEALIDLRDILHCI